MTNPPQIAQIVLQAVKDFDGTRNIAAGKQTLSRFLYGSKSKRMIHHSQQQGYGALYWKSIDVINGYLDQLREMELITTYKHSGPKWSYYALILTEASRKALEENIEIPLQDRHTEKTPRANNSAEKTRELLKKGHGPEKIAKIRNLKPSTIYTHCHTLIATGELSATKIIPQEKIIEILQAQRKRPNTQSLKEIKETPP